LPRHILVFKRLLNSILLLNEYFVANYITLVKSAPLMIMTATKSPGPITTKSIFKKLTEKANKV